MATYILKRKIYSLNPNKLTLSDISLEYGIQFPDEMKKLAKMERRIESKLHYWAVTSPYINMVASPEMIYAVLSQGGTIIPALVNSLGEVTLHYDTAAGQYRYGETLLEDPSALVNTVIGELNKAIELNNNMVQSGQVAGGEAEAMKQNAIYYQTYLDNVCLTFGMPSPTQEAQAQEVQ